MTVILTISGAASEQSPAPIMRCGDMLDAHVQAGFDVDHETVIAVGARRPLVRRDGLLMAAFAGSVGRIDLPFKMSVTRNALRTLGYVASVLAIDHQ